MSGRGSLMNDPDLYEFNPKPLLRTSAVGNFTQSGLKIGGKVTKVEINDTTWTELPASALSGRNAIAIQNDEIGAVDVRINYDDMVAGLEGILLRAGGERQYDISDAIKVYAKCVTGTHDIIVEELA